MNAEAARAAYDEQIRRHPEAGDPLAQAEVADGVVRVVSAAGWAGVTWSDLGEIGADAVIAAQVDWFADPDSGSDCEWEWKHYSYDRPADLPARLVAAGLTPEPSETLLIAEIADLSLDVAAPEGVRLVPVVDEEGAATLVHLHDEVFGGDHSRIGRTLLTGIAQRPPTAAGVIAMAGVVPIAAGRIEFHGGTEFASIWGGGTVPGWRHCGVFRALVSHRAALAADRGFRYLQVDATADSRPILERLGFVALATTTPFTHPGRRTAAPAG